MSAGDGSPPTLLHTPTRDASTIKNVLYGPGHEKFPSWPMAAAAEAPRATRAPPTGGSQRSKSWTDHTNYPKENLIAYSRPYMRRSHSAYPPQLKTVVERCEKNQPDRKYLHRMERSNKSFESNGISSPPERDIDYKGGQNYEISFEKQSLMKDSYNIMMNNKDNDSPPLTQADLEKYTRNYDEDTHQHQKQPSYAQSEGYHSYVSSTDSTSTSFLDRLGHDMELSVVRGGNSWDRDSVVTTSSSSASSSETLKWHGSLSDVSVASSSFSLGRQQLIAHSARVQTPQRHNSDSVSYIKQVNDGTASISERTYPTYTTQRSAEPQRENNINKSPPQRSVAERVHQYEEKVTKYTYLDPDKKTMLSDPALKAIQKKALLLFYERHQDQNKPSWRSEPQLSVKSSNNNSKHPPPYDPMDCGPKVPDQKEAMRNIPQNISNDSSIINNACQMKKPYNKIHAQQSTVHDLYKQQCNQNKTYESEHLTLGSVNSYKHHAVTNRTVCNTIERRSSTYSENHNYNKPSPTDIENNVKDNFSHVDIPSNNNESHNTALQGPVILGPAISLDDWVPERPPKNQQHLRSAFPDLYPQVPPSRSPDLPLPSPPTYEDEVSCNSDEPFPPPPFEIVDQWKYQQEVLDHHPPIDMKGMNNHDVALHSSNNQNKNYDHSNDKAREKFFHIPKKSPNNSIPIKPRLLNREYPNNHKIHEAQRRNSFSKTHESSRDMTLRNVNIRASVREIVRYPTSPTKQNISAQRQLYRSVTIDDSAVTPKKPINPFLRSTSMKVDDQKTDTLTKSYSTQKPSHLDKSKDQYNCMPKIILSEKIGVVTSEKVNKDVGKFRAEPLRPLETLQTSKGPMMNHKHITSPRYQSQRPMRPQEFKPHENEMIRKKCLSPPTKLSDEDPSRVHQCLLQQPHAEHAVVFNHQKSPTLQKPCLSPHSPTASTLAHSNNETIEKSNEAVSPQGQLRSPNKMEVTLETMMNGFKLVDSESTPLLSKLHQSIRESCANEEENMKKLCNNKIFAHPKDAVIHHEKMPSVSDERIDPPASVDNVASETVSVIPTEPPAPTATCVEIPINKRKIRHLKPRTQLPEEIEWRSFSSELTLQLPAEDPMKNLLSQYREYDSTVESICSFFEQQSNISSDDKQVKDESDSPENNVETTSSEDGGDSNEHSIVDEKSVINKVEEEPIKTIKLKKAACESLRALTQALTTEAGVLENEKIANEAAGVDLSLKSGIGVRFTRLGVDVELVTSLIVALTVRYARMKYTWHSPERKTSLMEKEAKLVEQLEEAKALKENIDRRVQKFFATPSMQSSEELVEGYDNFIYTTIKLVIYARDVRDRLNLTQKLLESIITEDSSVSLNKSVVS